MVDEKKAANELFAAFSFHLRQTYQAGISMIRLE